MRRSRFGVAAASAQRFSCGDFGPAVSRCGSGFSSLGAAVLVRKPRCGSFTRRQPRFSGPGAAGRGSADELGVVLGTQQGVVLGGIRHAHLYDPAFAVGVLVDDRGVGVDGLVEFEHFAAHGQEGVADSLHGLDRAEDLSGGEGFAHGRDIDEHDVAQLALCEVGNADYGHIALDPAPLVVVRVSEVCRYVHNAVIVLKLETSFFRAQI